MLGGIEDFEKSPLNSPDRIQKGPIFLENRHILTPNCGSRELRLTFKKKNLFFLFFLRFSGCACVQH